MSKQMICSRATEEQIEALWHAWDWPDQYLQEHHRLWLNSHCEYHWHGVSHALYFEHAADLHAWTAAHAREPQLTHRVVLTDELRHNVPELKRWCEQQWGADLFRGRCWPQGTWTYGHVLKVGMCMQFAHQEQAVQFALVFT